MSRLPWFLVLLAGCAGGKLGDRTDGPDTGDSGVDSGDSADSGETGVETPASRSLRVLVTLDGVPSPDTTVLQGGSPARWTTDAKGEATVTVDFTVIGDIYVIGSHPDARLWGEEVTPDTPEPLLIELERFDRSDNEAYVFQNPGEGDPLESSSADCIHCHITLHEGWYDSAHRQAASNPVLHDVYQGLGRAFDDEEACLAAGGTWGEVVAPGSGASLLACSVGEGVRPVTGGTGGCADCHAPGIDGVLGGRDLLEARDYAYDYGVHCDVCHRIEAVDPDGAPGVGGRLHLLRPSEESPSPALGDWYPLTFGPYEDVLNPRMGSVARGDLFHSATLCSGCHQDDQPVLVEGASIDLARWPDGTLPVHSTYAEWQAGPMNPSAPCQTCHMPPLPELSTSMDVAEGDEQGDLVGIVQGWIRPPGAVRAHTFSGPRDPESGMLQLAASLDARGVVADGVLTATVTTRNVGPGHAIPTGEPLRSLLLTVDATCDGVPLVPVGGDVVPDFGGYADVQTSSGDWSRWPGAAVGDVVRVVRRTGAWVDYVGFGPFGDGRFDAEAKGLPGEAYVGEAVVTAVAGDSVTLSAALPAGDLAYRIAAADVAAGLAGAPGFGFARVLVGADGARMVPHFAAVDVVSDNRLLPQTEWSSVHTFASPCEAPVIHARLVHRNYPLGLARERGWAVTDQTMVEVTR